MVGPPERVRWTAAAPRKWKGWLPQAAEISMGILVFAVNPMTGEHHWTQRLDSVPQKGFYENSGFEF